jgi:hypothetical protein
MIGLLDVSTCERGMLVRTARDFLVWFKQMPPDFYYALGWEEQDCEQWMWISPVRLSLSYPATAGQIDDATALQECGLLTPCIHSAQVVPTHAGREMVKWLRQEGWKPWWDYWIYQQPKPQC